MKTSLYRLPALILAPVITVATASASEFNIELGANIDYYPNNSEIAAQDDYNTNSSAYVRLEYDHDFQDGSIKFMLDGQARANQQDSRRSRADFNELALAYINDDVDITAGFLTEFWGVTESRHLVDIINQTNVAENIDEEVKLGQPMIKAQLHHEWGNLQFYWLPIFRERIYAGDNARLSPGDSINYQHALYESSSEDQHQDFALRYTHTIDAWDIGIAHFKGTSREPLLLLNINQLPSLSFTPYYEQMDQTSLDVQMTSDSLLLKLEAISRTSELQKTYQSAVTGFEYTQVGVFDSAMDVGYIAEYLYDERGDKATTPFADDIFTGLRLVANDIAQTTYLLGAYIDRENNSAAWRFEMNTRLKDGLTLSLEGQVFANQPADDLLFGFRNDDYFNIGLQWFF